MADSTRSRRSVRAVIGLAACGALLALAGLLFGRGMSALARPSEGANDGTHALLHVSSSEPYILFPPDRPSNPFRADLAAYQRTQEALIKSRLVLNAAIKRLPMDAPDVLKRQADPVGWLADNLRVDFEQPEILRVSIRDTEPKGAAVLVNAVVRAYLGEVVDLETKQKRDRYEHLKENWYRYQKNLEQKRSELRRLGEVEGAEAEGVASGRNRLLAEQFSACRRELLRVRLERAASETRLARRKAAKEHGDEAREAIDRLEEGLAVLDAQEKVLKEEEARLLMERRASNRATVDLSSIRQEIAAAEATAERIGAEVEVLNVELQAPPRVQLIEQAEPPRP
jgi:uncharacterized protein involved in exopolysaccharide biosynthesis